MSPVARGAGLAACLLLAISGPVAAGALPAGSPARALAAFGGRSTLTLVTRGRRTGRSHPVALWFVLEGGHLYVQSGREGHTDWYRNLLHDPRVEVKLGGVSVSARARPVEDPAEVERVHQLFRAKYWMAWLGSYLGSSLGQGLPVELEAMAASPPPAEAAAAGRGRSR